MTVTITTDANDTKAGMTLDELATFVQDAMRAGVEGCDLVRVRTGFRAQITQLQVPR